MPEDPSETATRIENLLLRLGDALATNKRPGPLLTLSNELAECWLDYRQATQRAIYRMQYHEQTTGDKGR